MKSTRHLLFILALLAGTILHAQPLKATWKVLTDSLGGNRGDTIWLLDPVAWPDGSVQSSAPSQSTHPDSAILFGGPDGAPTTDSAELIFNAGQNQLYLGDIKYLPNAKSRFMITGDVSNEAGMTITGVGSSTTPYLSFFRNRQSTLYHATDLGRINWGGYNGSAYFSDYPYIKAQTFLDWTGNQRSAQLQFVTRDLNNNAHHMVFSHNGSLVLNGSDLINSADTNYKLKVYGSGYFTGNSNSDTSFVNEEYSKGTNWATSTAYSFKDVCYGNGRFVATKGPGAGNNMYFSEDGVNWSESSVSTASVSPQAVCYGNGLFVCVGYGADFDDTCVATSVDGITWTIRKAVAGCFFGVAYGNGVFVAAGEDCGGSARLMYSYDGINWTGATHPSNHSAYNIAFGNGTFVVPVASGSAGQSAWTSSNGINWTVRSTSSGQSWYGITYGNGRFVMTSNSSNVCAVSTDNGTTWTVGNTPTSGTYLDIAYGDGVFVAVGGGSNRLITSTNGLNWTVRYSLSTYQYRSVAYGNGVFVSGTQNSYVSRNSHTFRQEVNSTRNGRNINHGSTEFTDTVIVERLVIENAEENNSATGLLVKNNQGQVGSIPFESGVYQPTDSSNFNISSLTIDSAAYTRIGNVVHVYGVITIDPDSSGVVSFYMDLPIARQSMGDYYWDAGNISAHQVNEHGAITYGNNGRVVVEYQATDTDAKYMYYNFSYRIQ